MEGGWWRVIWQQKEWRYQNPDLVHRYCVSAPVDTMHVVNRLNPIRYSANYFGHKLHIDQNEKLVSFGVTHIVARDGYSGKIVGFLTLPMKNVESVYRLVSRVRTPIVCLLHYISVRAWHYSCRSAVEELLRTDHGREFYLILYI